MKLTKSTVPAHSAIVFGLAKPSKERRPLVSRESSSARNSSTHSSTQRSSGANLLGKRCPALPNSTLFIQIESIAARKEKLARKQKSYLLLKTHNLFGLKSSTMVSVRTLLRLPVDWQFNVYVYILLVCTRVI